MAYSGRCLLSGYIYKRDPNQGTCTNSCRWKYDSHQVKENETGNIIAINPEILVKPQIFTPSPKDIIIPEQKPVDELVLLQE